MLYTYLLPFALLTATPATPVELIQVAEHMRQIKRLEVAMTQTKELQVFGERQVAKGSLLFARPRHLKMDLEGPGGSTLTIDGDTMTMHYKALKKTERFDIRRDPRARAISEHIFLLLEADPEALSKVYRAELLGKSPLRVRLTPVHEALAKIIRDIDVRFDPRGFVVDLFIRETNGDSTRWEFSKPKIEKQ